MESLKTLGRLRWAVCSCALLFTASARTADFYASPTGEPSGDGSITRPWKLGNALKGVAAVQPGDTIWLRGGVYRAYDRPSKYISHLQGTPEQPITVRQYPGERAIIDGNISQSEGGWVNYWGFEIMNSFKARVTGETGPFPKIFTGPDNRGDPTDFTVSGFDLRAPGVKLINMIVHDSIGGGIAINVAASNPEVYGTLSFYNGWQGGDRGHGHGLYAQGVDPSAALIRDNVFFSNYALGAQATGTKPVVDNFRFEGNVFFFNSSISQQHQGNLVVGSFSGQARNISILRNYFFETNPSATDVNIGYSGGIMNGAVQGNYFATRVVFSSHNENVRVVRNTIVDANAPGSATNIVFLRPNQFEPGRTHIIVYNWQNFPQVAVDLSTVLPLRTPFEIRNAQDILGPPVLAGVYEGNSVVLPMTGLPVAKTFLQDATASTAPLFNVFVLIPQTANGATSGNSPPSVTSIGNQVVVQNRPTLPIRFQVRDAEIPPDFLNVSVSSSNPTVVPLENIRFIGTGVNRSMRIVPGRDQVGSSLITLWVSDGLKATNATFTVTVNREFAGTP